MQAKITLAVEAALAVSQPDGALIDVIDRPFVRLAAERGKAFLHTDVGVLEALSALLVKVSDPAIAQNVMLGVQAGQDVRVIDGLRNFLDAHNVSARISRKAESCPNGNQLRLERDEITLRAFRFQLHIPAVAHEIDQHSELVPQVVHGQLQGVACQSPHFTVGVDGLDDVLAQGSIAFEIRGRALQTTQADAVQLLPFLFPALVDPGRQPPDVLRQRGKRQKIVFAEQIVKCRQHRQRMGAQGCLIRAGTAAVERGAVATRLDPDARAIDLAILYRSFKSELVGQRFKVGHLAFDEKQGAVLLETPGNRQTFEIIQRQTTPARILTDKTFFWHIALHQVPASLATAACQAEK